LRVNGELHQVAAREDEPLLWVLRDQLGLTGAKFGCGEGLCGACTVLVDGQAVRACQVPVSALDAGVAIETVEGLGSPERLSRVQASFVEHNAFGCGFCTPGQIMSATALLRSNPKPDRSAILAAMEGNLCRCAAYPNIIAAIEAAAGSRQERSGS
jgi:isoquinoline 1-oxidoreductase alpha subunit